MRVKVLRMELQQLCRQLFCRVSKYFYSTHPLQHPQPKPYTHVCCSWFGEGSRQTAQGQRYATRSAHHTRTCDAGTVYGVATSGAAGRQVPLLSNVHGAHLRCFHLGYTLLYALLCAMRAIAILVKRI